MNKSVFLIFILILFSCNKTEKVKPEQRINRLEEKSQHRRRSRLGPGVAESLSVYSIGDTIFVPQASPIRSKLKYSSAEKTEYTAQYTTTGVVRPLTGHRADIASPFEGRIVRSFINLGQKVNKGAPLFEVSSSDYFESVRLFLQAQNERDLAEKNYTRTKELFDSGVKSRKEFDESNLAFILADKEYNKAAAMLRILNLDPEKADLTQPLIIRAPISGEIVRSEIIVGQYLKSDADPVITIADIDNIWVVANVKEKDFNSIGKQDNVEIFSEMSNGNPVLGVIDYIGDIMNPDTRSVEVYIKCKNNDHKLKLGMFVSVKFYHDIPDAIIIPSEAVLQDHVKSYLFVKSGSDAFVKKEITVTSAPDRKLIVRSGLESGEEIVIEGSLYLR